MPDEDRAGERGQVEAVGPRPSSTNFLAAAALVGLLYFARDVFVPFAIAVLLSFVLSVPVRFLQSRGLGRAFPVGFVVVCAFLISLAVGGVLTSQLAGLATDLPSYQSTIREKIATMRKAATGSGPLEQVTDMLQTLSEDFAAGRTSGLVPDGQPGTGKPAEPAPVPVEITNTRTTPLQTISGVIGPLIHPLTMISLVAIFVVFILLQRADLRDRVIRLAGSGDLQRTTAAMNEAARRVSRLLLTQVLLNTAFGIIVGTGLWLLGVPSPILWGILGAISRFVPYVGIVLSSAGPLLLAAAVDPHWTMLIFAAALLFSCEFAFGQIIEPMLFGHTTGLSPLAIVAAVTFWTWLWGPVGLLLSTPLTVCLVVIGRHVERLEFLAILLGDRPPLTAAETFYQRALAGDAADILDGAEGFLKEHALLTYLDEVAIKGLALAQLDLSRNALGGPRLARIEGTLREVATELEHEGDDERADEPGAARGKLDPDALDPTLREGDEDEERLRNADAAAAALPCPGEAAGPARSVLCIAGRNGLDAICAAMLAQVLRQHGLSAEASGPDDLDVPPGQQAREVDVVCLSYLDSTRDAHMRYAVRRSRRRWPSAFILVGSWGMDGDDAKHLCSAARSDGCASTLLSAAQICLGTELDGRAGKMSTRSEARQELPPASPA